MGFGDFLSNVVSDVGGAVNDVGGAVTNLPNTLQHAPGVDQVEGGVKTGIQVVQATTGIGGSTSADDGSGTMNQSPATAGGNDNSSTVNDSTGAAKSYISGAKYGYDFVVATTAVSINATMKAFLDTVTEPLVHVCYIADAKTGDPTEISYEDLKIAAKGSDPFSIPADVDPKSNPDFQNLLQARFMMGFKARLGLPTVPEASAVPDLVELGDDTSQVAFNMLCSDFTVVELNPGGWGAASWMVQSQETTPWVFTSKVDLRLSLVSETAYSKLPAEVQNAIQNVGEDAFSVQQLLFDLTNAGLQSVPTIKGIAPGTKAYWMLQQVFVGAYFTAMQKAGQPMLACAIVKHAAPASSLHLTSFNFETCSYINTGGKTSAPTSADQQKLATLCYLCATDGKTLPPPVKFEWNWVDASEMNDHHGVIAINRNSFVNVFKPLLTPQAQKNCLVPSAHVWTSGPFRTEINYSGSLESGGVPIISAPETGSVVLRYDYHNGAFDQAGLGGDGGRLTLETAYSLEVQFVNSNIIVTQHLNVFCKVQKFQTHDSAQVIDMQIIDTYPLGIDQDGRLQVGDPGPPLQIDRSENIRTNWFFNFFTNFNSIADQISNAIKAFSGTQLHQLKLTAVQDFVFPGGKTFLFKNVRFSNQQDVIAFLTYADPDKAVPAATGA